MKNFTFKKHIAEGRYRSFRLDHTDIKLNKKVCGMIAESMESRRYHISFTVVREETKDFKWVTLKATFKDEKEAREYVRLRCFGLQKQLKLYSFEA